MAKKTRTELSTSAINTNLPDNTQELITPTTERSQLTDERESVINYKDDLGGTGNAGKFLTVAADGESLTMVDAPTGDVTGTGVQYQVAVWNGTNSLTGNAAFQFLTGAQNSIKLIRGTGSGNILFYAADGTTLHGYIENQVSGNGLTIGQQDGSTSAVIDLDDSTITFKTDNNTALTIDSGFVGIGTTNPLNLLQIGSTFPITINGNYPDIHFNGHYSAGYKPITTGHVGKFSFNPSSGVLEFSNSGGSYTAGVAYTPQSRFSISSGGLATFSNGIKFGTGNTLDAYEESTWTPNVESTAGGAYTISNARGKYIKVGKHVTVQFYFIVSNVNGGTGAKITNLPFATKSGSAGDNYIGNSWNTSNGQLSSAVAAQNGTIAYIYVYSGGNPIGQGQGNTGTITYISES